MDSLRGLCLSRFKPWRRSIPSRGTACAKALRQEYTCPVPRTARKPVSNEWGGWVGDEGREVRGGGIMYDQCTDRFFFFALCEMGNHCLFLNYNDGKCKHFQGKSNILISHVPSTPFQQLPSHEVMASPVSSQPLSLCLHPRTCPGINVGGRKHDSRAWYWSEGAVISFHPFKLYSIGLLNRNASI